MKSYLLSKVDKLASEASYYSIISDNSRTEELAQILGLDTQDFNDIKDRVIKVKDDYNQIEDKEFVYGDIYTLIGVHKIKGDRIDRK